MDKRKEFLEHPTQEVTHFLVMLSDKSNLLDRIMIQFVNALQQFFKGSDSLRILKTIHTVLCAFYQEKRRETNSQRKSEPAKLNMYERFINSFKRTDVNEIQRILYSQNLHSDKIWFDHWDKVSLVLDIASLHMVFYSQESTILKNLQELQDQIHTRLRNNNMWHLDIKLSNCYLDTLFLFRVRYKTNDRSYDSKITASFLKNIEIWLPNPKKQYEYDLLTLLLPKFIKLISGREILPKVWKLIFASQEYSSKTLFLLYHTADVWFPMEQIPNQKLVAQNLEEPFWLLLLEDHWMSSHLYQRVVEFDNKLKAQDSTAADYQEFAGNNSTRESYKKSINNLFLMLKVLEDDKKDLDTEVFPLIKSLLNETFDQKSSKTGFYVAWIHYAYSRLLEHSDYRIVKWALVNVFTLNPEIFTDEFLSTVMEGLDDTRLYENDLNQEEPLILKELIRFLNYTRTQGSDLVTRFMIQASEITWWSVPLIHIIHAISVIKRVDGIWTAVELKAMKSFARMSSLLYCPVLQFGSQIELLETMTHFGTESFDLMLIAKVLAKFSTSKVLIRGQLAWNRVSTWLSKIAKREEAVSFLEKICLQLGNENSQKDLSVKSFSLIIMLFHDARIVLDSKLCPGLAMLHDLLRCLIQTDCKRRLSNTELQNRSIEFIGYMLEFSSPRDCILREVISEYAEASLRFIFKNLRKICDESLLDNINTYVLVTQQLFTAESSIITKRDVLNYIERFEIESWNIIEDGEYSNNVQRLFGIKVLYVCLKSRSINLKNYKFITSLCKAYKSPMTQPSDTVDDANKSYYKNKILEKKIGTEYYKTVAELFYEYVKDEPAEEWTLAVNWIEEVTYLVQLEGEEILLPLIGILSQIFHKKAIRATDMDNFKTAIKLCWKSTLEAKECQLALLEVMMNLIFSTPFLEIEETRELTIEFTNEMVKKVYRIPGLSIILIKGLKQVEEEYLSHFYEALLVCLLYGNVLNCEDLIELQTRTYIFDCYQEVYPILSDMNVDDNAATRAHAIILLHKMITNNPAHAVLLSSLIITKLEEIRKELNSDNTKRHRFENRILQILLILQPMLKKVDLKSLYSVICDNILSENRSPGVRIMEEWMLIRIYLGNETFLKRIWDLFDQGQEKCLGGSSSALRVCYHVARLLSPEVQAEFINIAFEYIIPCCMAQQSNLRYYAQVTASKLYSLAIEMNHRNISEKYKHLQMAVLKSLKFDNQEIKPIRILDDFYFTVFHPSDDYSLQTIFYELPKLSNASSDEWIPSAMYDKFGFTESENHPLKLLDVKNNVKHVQVPVEEFKFAEIAEPEAAVIDGSIDHSNEMQMSFTASDEEIKPNVDELSEVSKTPVKSQGITVKEENDIILVTSLLDKLPNLRALGRVCKKLGVKEFVLACINHPEERQFQTFTASAEKLFSLVEVKPQELQEYLVGKKNMGYRLIGAGQASNTTNLMDLKLEGKSVLLLGNEKAGIPASLIPLLHKCVEIP